MEINREDMLELTRRMTIARNCFGRIAGEVYNFLICAICPVTGDYEAGETQKGFLFPAFSDRAGDIEGIDVFSADGNPQALMEMLF